ncbi:hypothetical protein Tco_0936509 [Tanacetum coccineum]
MKRGYAGDIIPLLPAMLAGAAVDQGKGSAQPAEPHHTLVDPISSTSQPPIPSPPHPSPPPHSPPQSPPHSPHQSPPLSPFQSPAYSPPHSSPPSLVTRVTSLEKELKDTKQTLGTDVLKLGKEPEDQGRIIQDIDDDPLVSLVRESIKEKSTNFVTPTKASREAQEEEISPTILEAAKTLSKVASQSVSKAKSNDKGKRYRRRARSMAKKINTGLDAEDGINTGRVEINTGRVKINTGIEDVNTGSAKVDSGSASKRGQREGKAPMVEEDIQATHKTKEQIRQEEAGLEEAIKLQAQMDEEVAKQIHLDELIAKRMAEEEALSEQQKKRKAQAKLKRYGEELQIKTSKKQRINDKDFPAIGEKVAEVKEEEQIIRANGADTVYISFGAMIKDFTREDLIELYRLVMQKYGTNRPEDAYDRVLWSDLRTMFDPPLNEDAIWSLPLQQKMAIKISIVKRSLSSDAENEASRWKNE